MATEMKRTPMTGNRIEELLGDEARSLLDHKSTVIPKEQIYLPGPDFIDRVVAQPIARRQSCDRSRRWLVMGGWREPATLYSSSRSGIELSGRRFLRA
jgi:hypothetical protein